MAYNEQQRMILNMTTAYMIEACLLLEQRSGKWSDWTAQAQWECWGWTWSHHLRSPHLSHCQMCKMMLNCCEDRR